jgi:hypothetical protein
MPGETLTAKLRSLPTLDIRIGLVVATLLAGLNALWTGWASADTIYLIQKQSEAGLCTFGMTLPYRSIRIALALVIAAVTLSFLKAKGILASLLSLSWVCAEYWLWQVESQQILINAGILRFPVETPHAFNLYGATDWNVIVFLVSGVLLIWEMKILSSALISYYRKSVY